VRAEERRANGCFEYINDSRLVVIDDQEEFDDQEIVNRFGRSLAGGKEEVDHEEGRSFAFTVGIGLAFGHSLIGATTQI
jgi:hypothetical protein